MRDEILYLDRNENYYGPAPACFDILKNADISKISCYSKSFTKGSKSILAARLAEEFDLPENRIVLGYGAEDILKQAVQCYLSNGAKLLVPTYSWWYYKAIADEVDGVNVEYPIEKGENTFYYNVDKLLDLYRKEKPGMVFISAPNNPTGNAIEEGQLLRILDEINDAIIVIDEAYAYDGFVERANLVRKYPNLMVVRTFSKYFALAGLRIGYAVIGDNISKLVKFTNRYLGYNRLNEEIAIAALDSGEYYKQVAEKMAADRKMFTEELSKFPGFTVFESHANFMLVEIPESVKEGLKKTPGFQEPDNKIHERGSSEPSS